MTTNSKRLLSQYLTQINQATAEVERCNDEIIKLKQQVNTLKYELQCRKLNLTSFRNYVTLLKEQYKIEQFSLVNPLLRHVYQFWQRFSAKLPHALQRWTYSLERKIYPLDNKISQIPAPLSETNIKISHHEAKLFQQALNEKSDRYDFIIFPVIDWHFRIQRPQHMAKEFAKMGSRVFYLCTEFDDIDTRNQNKVRLVESPEHRVYICKISCPSPKPNIYNDTLKLEARDHILNAIDQLRHRCDISRVLSIIHLPFWRSIAEGIPGNMVIYDCMDHHAGFSNNSATMLNEEQQLLKKADLVITTAERLSVKIAETTPNTLIRNAAEVQRFNTPPQKLLYQSSHVVIGYIGAISEWYDLELVIKCALHYPQWDFVLIGCTYLCSTEKAEKISNIKLLGEIPYTSIAGYLHCFDVCIIPFKIIELTLCTNPVKVYEYLAAGKPVVATALPELQLIADYCHVAHSTSAFIAKLAIAVAEKDDAVLAEKRAQWAMQHSWANRTKEFDHAISKLYPLVSIIVLTYNNLSYTQACLHGLTQFTGYPNLEIIVVDNASTDGSQEYLSQFKETHPDLIIKLQLNAHNLGFAAGNNVGLKIAIGEIIVLLNNDTYATTGWLTTLVKHLTHHPDIALLGPVTNNIGNEAKISINYSNMDEMAQFSRIYTASHSQQLLLVNNVAFFCVALRRTLLAEIGYLDEDFGLGFFEDDDYCKRVKKAGYKIAIAEDVFIHHHLSASFNQLTKATKQTLFDKNKIIYEQKWGEWTPHRYREE